MLEPALPKPRGTRRASRFSTAGHERGIGVIDFALTEDPASGEPQIVTALVGSPAYRAGLQPQDILTAINGRPTAGLLHEEVLTALRGSSGSVLLKVKRDGSTRMLSVPRKQWDEQAVVHRGSIRNGQRVGYIAIRLFTADSGKQVREAVKSLTAHGIDRCILDLRNNPGGYLDAMAVAGSAFTTAQLGWKVRRNGIREPISSAEKPLNSMRLAILVNSGTASAAEALAAALRDTRGAVLVESTTFGRGQVQTYVSLSDAEGIILPTAKIESPSGYSSNNRAGLKPDYTMVPVPGNDSDVALLKALQILAPPKA